MRPRLRLFTGEESDAFDAPPVMTISFGELLAIIESAAQSDSSWLKDFAQDDIMITEDLYEVVTEYSRLRPGA